MSKNDVMMVYIAGPMTFGNPTRNLREALEIANAVRLHGHVPFVPQLSAFWDLAYPISGEEWLQMDFRAISRCDALIRIVGTGPGADREVGCAKYHGLKIFGADGGTSNMALIFEFQQWLRDRQNPQVPPGPEGEDSSLDAVVQRFPWRNDEGQR